MPTALTKRQSDVYQNKISKIGKERKKAAQRQQKETKKILDKLLTASPSETVKLSDQLVKLKNKQQSEELGLKKKQLLARLEYLKKIKGMK